MRLPSECNSFFRLPHHYQVHFFVVWHSITSICSLQANTIYTIRGFNDCQEKYKL